MTVDYEEIERRMRLVANDVQTSMVSQIAKESSKEAVTEILLVCGIDASNPTKMQELMAYGHKCKENAERMNETIKWVEGAKKNTGIFKTNMIAEAGKMAFVAVVAVVAVWLSNITGLMK